MRKTTTQRPLILASASPRRRELLGLLGLPFSIRRAMIDESLYPDENPVAAVLRLAQQKAETVARDQRWINAPIVIGSDTIVALDGKVLGKPKSEADAEMTLRRLRGREHQVYTALSLITAPGTAPLDCVAETQVPMRHYDDHEIMLYVRSGDPFDKAGAYAIQNRSFQPVVNLSGCYANVMGLPLCHLACLLTGLGVAPGADVPSVCQARLEYDCDVYDQVKTCVSQQEVV